MPDLADRDPTLSYATAALEISGVAAAVIDSSGELTWCTPPFEAKASALQTPNSQELLEEIVSKLNPLVDDSGCVYSTVLLESGRACTASMRTLGTQGEVLVVLRDAPIGQGGSEPETASAAEWSCDVVTGLPNRAALEAAFRRRFDTSGEFALLFIDIDGFKQINDSLGHLVGDRALHELASRMRQSLREHDFVARFGGDEFIAIVEGVDSSASLTPVLERLHAAIRPPLSIDEHSLLVTASIGAALSVDAYQSCEAMLHAADVGMYATRSSRTPARR